MANVTGNPGAPPPALWYALQWQSGAAQEISVTASYVPLAPMLLAAGFYPAQPLPVPGSPADLAWTRLRNVTGLIPGVTTLASELSLLYSANEIGPSAVAPNLNFVWDGTTFSPH
jgi:hypothetical protein